MADRLLRTWALLERAATPFGNLLLPPRCACCDIDLPALVADTLLCSRCQRDFVQNDIIRCPRCAEPLPGDGLVACADCREQLPEFECAWTLGDYSGELRAAVLKIKRLGAEPLAGAVAQLLYEQCGDRIRAWRPDAVLSVPMHWLRRLVRGANSAEILGSYLARRLGLPYAANCAVRCRHTRRQSGLAPGDRLRNVRGAFRLSRGVDLSGARILVVDDILTTGATCSEIARLLTRSGASATAVVVAARASGKR